jgi:hypothetical protein
MKNNQIRHKTNSVSPGKKSRGYAESFLAGFEIMIVGFVIEIFLKGQGIRSPHMPYNLLLLCFLVIILVFSHLFLRSTPFVRWLSSVPCSISAITIYAFMILLLGFVPQEGDNRSPWLQLLGLNHVKNSWPFMLIQFYLLISLGLVVPRRAFPFTRKNIGFLMNHLGLWITLVAIGLGSGDLKRVTINLYENEDYTHAGILSGQQDMIEMPFSARLLDFDIELYNPKIAVADVLKGKIVQKHGETLPIIHKGFETTLIDWEIQVKEYMPLAVKTDSGFIEADKPGNMAVAFVETRNKITGDTVSGWIASGSMMFESRFLDLSRSKLLILTEPEPKKFESIIVVKDAKGDTSTIRLEVNKPHRVAGWKLYQISYDTQMGRYSTLSVIEAVRDPWLPLVYTGITLLLCGALYLFWLGRGVRSKE